MSRFKIALNQEKASLLNTPLPERCIKMTKMKCSIGLSRWFDCVSLTDRQYRQEEGL